MKIFIYVCIRIHTYIKQIFPFEAFVVEKKLYDRYPENKFSILYIYIYNLTLIFIIFIQLLNHLGAHIITVLYSYEIKKKRESVR